MPTTSLVVTALILASRLTIHEVDPKEAARTEEALKIQKVKATFKILCEHPSVKCERKKDEMKEDEKDDFDFWVVKRGKNGAVIFADITPTGMAKASSLTYLNIPVLILFKRKPKLLS